MRERLSVGFEVLYGENQKESGASGHVFRNQVGVAYSGVGRGQPVTQFGTWRHGSAWSSIKPVVATAVGALLLARVVDDPALSKAMRKAARAFIKDSAG